MNGVPSRMVDVLYQDVAVPSCVIKSNHLGEQYSLSPGTTELSGTFSGVINVRNPSQGACRWDHIARDAALPYYVNIFTANTTCSGTPQAIGYGPHQHVYLFAPDQVRVEFYFGFTAPGTVLSRFILAFFGEGTLEADGTAVISNQLAGGGTATVSFHDAARTPCRYWGPSPGNPPPGFPTCPAAYHVWLAANSSTYTWPREGGTPVSGVAVYSDWAQLRAQFSDDPEIQYTHFTGGTSPIRAAIYFIFGEPIPVGQPPKEDSPGWKLKFWNVCNPDSAFSPFTIVYHGGLGPCPPTTPAGWTLVTNPGGGTPLLSLTAST